MKKIASLFFCVLTFFSFSVGQPLINDLGFASLKIDSSAMESACEIYVQYFVDSSQKEKFIYDCADRNGIGFIPYWIPPFVFILQVTKQNKFWR